jgi:hypothetical protein
VKTFSSKKPCVSDINPILVKRICFTFEKANYGKCPFTETSHIILIKENGSTIF